MVFIKIFLLLALTLIFYGLCNVLSKGAKCGQFKAILKVFLCLLGFHCFSYWEIYFDDINCIAADG
jgi:hypothetical protein